MSDSYIPVPLFHKKLGSGNPLIILHGLFGSLDNWQTLAKKWAIHNEVWLLDARNHGHSPHSSEFSYLHMMADLIHFVKENNLTEITLLGHSMGGKTAMLFAHHYPKYLKQLIVVDIAPKTYQPHHQTILEAFNSIDFDFVTSRKEADQMMQQTITDGRVRQFLLKNLKWETKERLVWKINLPVLSEKIHEINKGQEQVHVEVPTLFIKGGASNYILEEDTLLLNKQFPNNNIITVANAGHWVHAEAQDEFYSIVNEVIICGLIS